jgi:hypothetical protein
MTADLTPPPIKRWRVVIDSPELPEKYEFEVEARVKVEAMVRGAEHAVAVAGGRAVPSLRRGGSQEIQVLNVAGYAEATEL